VTTGVCLVRPFVIELEGFPELPPSPKLAISAVDVGGAPSVSSFSVRMMFLDEPLVGLLDRVGIGIGLEPKRSISGRVIGHASRFNPA